jgi:NAD(P)-dependent dehydrogenase (short-subunit alcohol dehydrogenase family)
MGKVAGRLSGAVAIVTGSTKGIGKTIAMRFAAEGAKVVVSGRNSEAGCQVVEEIAAAKAESVFQQFDVGIEQDVRALVARAADKWGRLDILVNNAAPADFIGAGGDMPVTELPLTNWEYLMRTCATGPFLTCKYAIPLMQKGGGGSIVNISSMASKLGVPRMPAYSAAKAALNSLTRQVAVEYGATGIRSNVVVLGFVLSSEVTQRVYDDPVTGPGVRAMSLVGLGTPEDVANAALFLSSAEGKFITGIEMIVDGGVLIRPYAPDFRAALS